MKKDNSPQNNEQNKRKFPGKLFVTLLLLTAAAVGVYLYMDSLLSPVAPGNGKVVEVTVEKGATSRDVASLLQEKGLIKDSRVFIYYSRFTGMHGDLKPGKYKLSPSLSMKEIAGRLISGPRYETIQFTIPEGYTVEKIAELLKEKDLIEKEKFFEVVSGGEFSYEFINEKLPKGKYRLEGYLYPDTYRVKENVSEKEIVDILLNRFHKEMQKLDLSQNAKDLNLSLHEAVTLASMIEKEAKVDGERALISGVILNRLKMGKLLQIDATVQYALKEHKEILTYDDLEVQSPYNTYKNPGLPPAPICSPGKKSLKAAVEPEDTEYLYYVAKPDGSHAFSKTLEGHNANIQKYQ